MSDKPVYTYTHAEYAALEAEIERLRAERDALRATLAAIEKLARQTDKVMSGAILRTIQGR